MDGPGIARESHKQAFRERKVASIVLPVECKVGLDLFCGRLWLISDVFVMFWISLYRFVLLRSDWGSV